MFTGFGQELLRDVVNFKDLQEDLGLTLGKTKQIPKASESKKDIKEDLQQTLGMP